MLKRAFLYASFVLVFSVATAAQPTPLMRAHAHNDYEHTRPLFDALEQGFGSVEADIWLVDGKLLVSHSAKDVKPERTLEKLYLDPLRARVRQNGGRVYRGGPTITLLVDVKSEAVATYGVLDEVLKRYAEMLTTFRDGKIEAKAITVIVSGNRAPKEMLVQPLRYAAMDGRSGDLETNPPVTLVPWISENWQKLFTWKWEGAMPEAERAALKTFLERAHAQGRKVRFWNTPDKPEGWDFLLAAGVDVIGTDDLAGLGSYFASHPKK